jgi:DNA-binding HxlR family transcriptional regulator
MVRDWEYDIYVALNMGARSFVQLEQTMRCDRTELRKQLDKFIQKGTIEQYIDPDDPKKQKLIITMRGINIQTPQLMLEWFDYNLDQKQKTIERILKKIGKKAIFKNVKIETIFTPELTIDNIKNKEMVFPQPATSMRYTSDKKLLKFVDLFCDEINIIMNQTNIIVFGKSLMKFPDTRNMNGKVKDMIDKSTNLVYESIIQLLDTQRPRSKKALESHLTFGIKGYNQLRRLQKMFS